MRLHRVRLRSFGGVADREVRFATQGVTVIEGPNEVGKTSIPKALDLLLTLRDRSKSSLVKAVQPFGSDEGPEVEAEMTTGPYRLVYRKRWLRKPETALQIVSPQHEKLSGDEAHDRVEAILKKTLDDALWEALRLQQGEKLALPRPGTRDDDKRTLGDVPSLAEALDQAASGDAAAEEDDDLWSRICAEYQRYWTANGRPRKDRNLSADRVAGARARLADIDAQLAQLAADSAELERLAAAEHALGAALDRCRRQENVLSARREATEQARGEVDRLQAARQQAEQHRERIADEQRRRRELIAAAESRARDVTELERQVAQAEPERAEASEQLEGAEAALEVAAAALQSAEAVHDSAVADRDLHRNRIEIQQLSERLERVESAEIELREAQALLHAATVDDEMLRAIEQAHLEAERAEAAASAAAASVQATASRPLALEIDGQPVDLAAGETRQTEVDDEIVLALPDTIEIRVRAGAGALSLAERRRSAKQELYRLCGQAGVADLSEARRAAELRKEAGRRSVDAQATIRQDLRDLTEDDLRGKVEGLRRRVAVYEAARPEQPPMPADFEAAKLAASAAEGLLNQRRADLRDREEAQASAAIREARLGDSNLVGRLEAAQDNKLQVEADLAAARSHRSDSLIAAELAQAEEAAAFARGALTDAETHWSAADSASLIDALEVAADAVRSALDDLQVNKQEQARLHGQLSALGERGLHTSRADGDAELRHIEREHDRLEDKAEAARLLHETFAQRRQEARSRHSRPFRQRIEQLGRIVFGSTFEVAIDDGLRIVSRTLDGVTLELDQLSTGAKEQLAVICLLACAAIVSPVDGGAPVIIDDALGWSDPQRQWLMGQAIDAAGQDCQVIILTCEPGRYAGIANATTVRLQN